MPIRLREIRKQHHFSQKDVASLLHGKRNMVTDYETGKTIVPLEKAVKLIDYFQVSLDYFIGFCDDPKPYAHSVIYTDTPVLTCCRERMKQLRTDHHHTQKELGKLLNISYWTLVRVERGYTHIITLPLVTSLAALYETPSDYIVGLTDEKVRKPAGLPPEMKLPDPDFPSRLEYLLHRDHLDTVSVSKILNVFPAVVGTWKNGKALPVTTNLVDLAALFHVSVDYLLGRTEDPKPYKPRNDYSREKLRSLITERLKTLREANFYYVGEVHERLSMSWTGYWKYENGRSTMRTEYLCRLADLYKVPTDYILCLTDVSVSHAMNPSESEGEEPLLNSAGNS